MERYSRQLPIKEIGKAGQKRLLASSALVIGAGGLGSTLLFCLCGAGVGHIGIIDDDVVSMSNLNRQFLHSVSDIGVPKTVSAVEKLSAFNPQVRFDTYQTRVTEENAEALIYGYDIILPAVDNMSTRLAVNSACCRLKTPLINGGINGMSGSLQIVEPYKTACLSCLYEKMRGKDPISYSFAPVVSTISSLMAQAALMLLLGQPNPLPGQMLYYDGHSLSFEAIPITRADNCKVCGNR